MGRVGRHKRVKAIDPFSKRRGHKAIKKVVDLPPSRDDEESDEKQASKKRKEKRKGLGALTSSMFLKDGVEISLSDSLPEERLIDKDKGFGRMKQESRSTSFKQRKGENVETYFDRIDKETTEIVRRQIQSKTSTSERRKRVMKERTEKRRKRKKKNDVSIEGKEEFVKDKVRFGEVVKAPPLLVVPRSVKKRTEAKNKKDTMHIEHMEKERKRAVAAYKLAKQRKRGKNT